MEYIHIIEGLEVVEICCTDNIEHDFFTYLNATAWDLPAEFLAVTFHYHDGTLDCVVVEYTDTFLEILPIANRRNVWTANYYNRGARH